MLVSDFTIDKVSPISKARGRFLKYDTKSDVYFSTSTITPSPANALNRETKRGKPTPCVTLHGKRFTPKMYDEVHEGR